MERIIFDTSKVKIVPIEQLEPNPWNPKEKGTKEYEQVKQSIRKKGLRETIKVRPLAKDRYQIIDGEQRFLSCTELGYKNVIIYDLGSISDKEAKELTIAFETQVPFEKGREAQLITDLVSEFGNMVELPYDDDYVQEILKTTSFDWNDFQENDHKQQERGKATKEVTCPECGHKFMS